MQNISLNECTERLFYTPSHLATRGQVKHCCILRYWGQSQLCGFFFCVCIITLPPLWLLQIVHSITLVSLGREFRHSDLIHYALKIINNPNQSFHFVLRTEQSFTDRMCWHRGLISLTQKTGLEAWIIKLC